MTEMQMRSFEVRMTDTEERTVTGIAVPFGETIDVGGFRESIAPEAFRDAQPGTPVYWGHDHRTQGMPIGKVTAFRSTETGLEMDAVLSKTAKADEVYTLLRDGVINSFSIGFNPTEYRTEDDVTVWTRAELKEVSVVGFPAYAGATVTEVRTELPDISAGQVETPNTNIKGETHMTEINVAPEVEELRETVSDLERKFSMLEVRESAPVAQFRSFGEYAQALAAGDEKAETFYRVYSGANTGDAIVKDAWVSSTINLVDKGRPTLNAFSKSVLPASGNNIEYAVLTSNSVATADQGGEGVDLGYGEVVVDTATAAVKTFGGYTSMTRQAIERSTVPYLDTVFRAMAQGYAKATNAKTVAVLAANGDVQTGTIAAYSATGVLAGLANAVADINDETGLGADFILLSTDVYIKLASVVDGSGRPLMNISGQSVNGLGNASIGSLSGSVAGVPFVVDPALSANTMFVASREGLVTYESAGAPLNLSDENIIALTKDFSVYGYIAVTVPQPKAIVKVTVPVGS